MGKIVQFEEPRKNKSTKESSDRFKLKPEEADSFRKRYNKILKSDLHCYDGRTNNPIQDLRGIESFVEITKSGRNTLNRIYIGAVMGYDIGFVKGRMCCLKETAGT